MTNFWITFLAQFRKEWKNTPNTFGKYLSLLLWPMITFATTYFVFQTFDLSVVTFVRTKAEFLEFLIIGMLIYNCFWLMTQESIMKNREERRAGTLEVIDLAPSSKLALSLGRSSANFLQNSWLFIIFAVTIIIFNANDFSLLLLIKLLLMLVILISSAIIWGIFIDTICTALVNTEFLFIICSSMMNLFSGVTIPIDLFPLSFQIIGSIFPCTYIIILVRGIFGINPINYRFIATTIVVFIILIGLTALINKLSFEHNRQTGNLQNYY